MCEFVYSNREKCEEQVVNKTHYCTGHICRKCLKSSEYVKPKSIYVDFNIGLCKECLDWYLNASSIDKFYGNSVLKIIKFCNECRCNLMSPKEQQLHFGYNATTQVQQKNTRHLCTAINVWYNIKISKECVCNENCLVPLLDQCFSLDEMQKWYNNDKISILKKLCSSIKYFNTLA